MNINPSDNFTEQRDSGKLSEFSLARIQVYSIYRLTDRSNPTDHIAKGLIRIRRYDLAGVRRLTYHDSRKCQHIFNLSALTADTIYTAENVNK